MRRTTILAGLASAATLAAPAAAAATTTTTTTTYQANIPVNAVVWNPCDWMPVWVTGTVRGQLTKTTGNGQTQINGSLDTSNLHGAEWFGTTFTSAGTQTFSMTFGSAGGTGSAAVDAEFTGSNGESPALKGTLNVTVSQTGGVSWNISNPSLSC
jgi:hypothetical protein